MQNCIYSYFSFDTIKVLLAKVRITAVYTLIAICDRNSDTMCDGWRRDDLSVCVFICFYTHWVSSLSP